jgi:ERCC4-type nuclease
VILLDSRGGQNQDYINTLVGHIKRIGVQVELTQLQYGDVAFEGKGPDGTIMVGIELKKLHDILNCIDDSRYNMQRVGMKQMYQVSALYVEGHWKPHDSSGLLMEGFNGGVSFGYCKHRTGRTMYAKLRRYLYSVSLSGVLVCHCRDAFHTAYDICELFHYFQKRWTDHTSLLETQKLNIPALTRRPTLCRKWAADLTDIGVKLSLDAERHFRTPIQLANADEKDWLRIPGVGVKTAQQIVREIMGAK